MGKIKNIETIYRILDTQDSGYEAWCGTQDDIVEYLKEQKDCFDYEEDVGWVKNLENYGLTFEIIN